MADQQSSQLYRFSVPVNLYFSVEATSREEADELGKRVAAYIQESCESVLRGDDVYLDEGLEIEDVCVWEASETGSTIDLVEIRDRE